MELLLREMGGSLTGGAVTNIKEKHGTAWKRSKNKSAVFSFEPDKPAIHMAFKRNRGNSIWLKEKRNARI